MEWIRDERKAAANVANHGVLFTTAVLALEDEYRVNVPDPHADDDRWRTIGMVDCMTLFVVHTVLEDDGSGRIITARAATPRKRRYYERLRF